MTSPVQTLLVDRDGVINRMRRDYVKSWDELELLPGSIESLAAASRRGWMVVVLSNQSAIGRGLVTRETVDQIHHRIAAMVTAAGGTIAGFLVCPHTPDDRCGCRKPAPGLLLRARDELGVDLTRAVLIGDQPTDVEAARAAGCAGMLIDEGELPAAIELISRISQVEEAIILCGGLGTRLRGALGPRPKALAPVNGRPFLEWLLLGAARRGVRMVILAIGHGAAAIRDQVDGAAFGLEVKFSEESEPLGTGGAARLAADLAQNSPVLVLNGDSYARFNLIQLQLDHLRAGAPATLCLHAANNAERFGSVDLAADGQINAFREKADSSGVINAGVYLFDLDVLCAIPSHRQVSLERDVFPSLVGHGLNGVLCSGPFVDIGTPESLAAAGSTLAAELRELESQAWTNA